MKEWRQVVVTLRTACFKQNVKDMPAAILSTIRRDGWQWRNERETFHGNAQMMIKNWVLKGLNNASPSLAAAKMVCLTQLPNQ